MDLKLHRSIHERSLKAGTGFLTKRFLKLSSGEAVLAGAGQRASAGVCMIETEVGDMAPVISHGFALVEVGSGGVTEGGDVTSDANGKAVALAALDLDGTGTPVTAGAADPSFTGGSLPSKLNGVAQETVSENGFALIKLV